MLNYISIDIQQDLGVIPCCLSMICSCTRYPEWILKVCRVPPAPGSVRRTQSRCSGGWLVGWLFLLVIELVGWVFLCLFLILAVLEQKSVNWGDIIWSWFFFTKVC